jgi:hypothetical protein
VSSNDDNGSLFANPCLDGFEPVLDPGLFFRISDVPGNNIQTTLREEELVGGVIELLT